MGLSASSSRSSIRGGGGVPAAGEGGAARRGRKEGARGARDQGAAATWSPSETGGGGAGAGML